VLFSFFNSLNSEKFKGKTKAGIRWRRVAALGCRACSSGDRSQGEKSAHLGNFGTTQFKRLKLINPSQLIMGLAIRASPAHLLLCPWGSCQGQSQGIVLSALLLGRRYGRAWPREREREDTQNPSPEVSMWSA
jgi:hypothetical protein